MRKYQLTFHILSVISLLALATMVIVLIYFYKGNVQSYLPNEVVKEYNIQIKKYQNRDVFIINAKEGATSQKVIFYIHGGSYVSELQKQHWDFFKKVVDDTGMTIVIPDYPLTPKNQYVQTLNMVIPLYKEVQTKVEKENLILMGDSAGGGMALAITQKIGEEGGKQPSKLILLSPWLDVSMANLKMDEVQPNDPILNKQMLKLAGNAYAGSEAEVKNQLVSPLYGPVENLENVVIYTGTYDILNPDVYELKEKAEKSNVSIRIKETEGALHNWILDYQDEKATNAYKDLIGELNDNEG